MAATSFVRRFPLIVALAFAGPAFAQYANSSLGLGIAYIGLTGGDDNAGLGKAVPVQLQFSQYLDEGFVFVAQAQVMLLHSDFGVDDSSNGAGWVFGVGGAIGVHYLFSQELLRPWVGIQIAGFGALRDPNLILVGPGVCAGLEYFLTDTISIGARAGLDVYLSSLNHPPIWGPNASALVSVYF